MKDKIDFSEIPHNYSVCVNRQCPRADHCLRQLAEQSLPDKIEFWSYARPKQVAGPEYDCPFYRNSRKVRYAKGMIALLENLPHKQMIEITRSLIAYFNRRTYYRIRKGERILSPAEQDKVLEILRQHGVENPNKFDFYFEDYAWFNPG